MSKVILNGEESDVLSRALGHFVLRQRTGELGIIHGMNRFVSTHDSYRKADIKHLKAVFNKLGINLISR